MHADVSQLCTPVTEVGHTDPFPQPLLVYHNGVFLGIPSFMLKLVK